MKINFFHFIGKLFIVYRNNLLLKRICCFFKFFKLQIICILIFRLFKIVVKRIESYWLLLTFMSIKFFRMMLRGWGFETIFRYIVCLKFILCKLKNKVGIVNKVKLFWMLIWKNVFKISQIIILLIFIILRLLSKRKKLIHLKQDVY